MNMSTPENNQWTDMTSVFTSTISELTTMTSSPLTGSATVEMEKVVPVPEEQALNEDFMYALRAVVGPIFIIFGLAGNSVSILTWNRPGMKSSTGRYLTAQAVADNTLLCFALLVICLPAWFPDLNYQYAYGVFHSYVGYPLIFFSALCTVWITVGVTVDRYIMVCWITKAKQYCNEKRANLGIALIVLNCFLVNTPRYASFKPVRPDGDPAQTPNGDNSSHEIPLEIPYKRQTHEYTEFGSGQGGSIYDFWVHCIFLTLVPWSCVFLMNAVIIKKIKNSNKGMADKKSSQAVKKSKESENQITRLLLVVSFTFLVLLGIQCITDCLVFKLPYTAKWMEIVAVISHSKISFIINSSLNFILYCMSGRRFRAELMRMLGIKQKDQQSSTSMVDGTTSTSGAI